MSVPASLRFDPEGLVGPTSRSNTPGRPKSAPETRPDPKGLRGRACCLSPGGEPITSRKLSAGPNRASKPTSSRGRPRTRESKRERASPAQSIQRAGSPSERHAHSLDSRPIKRAETIRSASLPPPIVHDKFTAAPKMSKPEKQKLPPLTPHDRRSKWVNVAIALGAMLLILFSYVSLAFATNGTLRDMYKLSKMACVGFGIGFGVLFLSAIVLIYTTVEKDEEVIF
jgi:hypothetical protein